MKLTVRFPEAPVVGGYVAPREEKGAGSNGVAIRRFPTSRGFPPLPAFLVSSVKKLLLEPE
eukprot:3201366-Rhodomonas_salina.1